MRFVLGKILEKLLFIIMTPMFMINGVVRAWWTIFGDLRGEGTVYNLILYGVRNLGHYNCGIVVCKKTGDNIWSSEGSTFVLDIPKSVLRMKVSTWDIKDGKLWIKVAINDRLLDKLEKELKGKVQNEVKENH